MRQIILDALGWKEKDDFYGDLLPSLGAPNWHGRNLDALNDSIRGDDIKKDEDSIFISYRKHWLGAIRVI